MRLSTGSDGLNEILHMEQRDALSIDRWKAFAEYLHLTPVSTVEGACDPVLFEAEEILRQYVSALRRVYTPREPMVPFTCQSEDSVILSEDVSCMICCVPRFVRQFGLALGTHHELDGAVVLG